MKMQSETVELFVNGVSRSLDAQTLADVVLREGLEGFKVATAVNGRFIPVTERSTTVLSSGDTIEIVSARQGG